MKSENHSTRKFLTSRAKSAMPLKYISNSSPFEIIPNEVTFPDIIPKQLYEITVLIRNLTKIPRRIRIIQPQTSKFRCDFDMQGVIAAGLSLRLIIYFETAEIGQFHDVLKLLSDENFEFNLRLHALPPIPSIKFDKFVNFGFCKLNIPMEKTVKFRNEGTSSGKVELRTTEKLKYIKTEPSVFNISPFQEIEVKIIYTPKEGGIIRGILEVLVDGISYQSNIEISATSVEYNKFIINESGAKTDNFNFGPMYFGQNKEIKAFLVNNTPQMYLFKTKFRLGIINEENNQGSLQTPNEVGYEQTERIISCFPSEGKIQSYSQIPITFKCKSKVTDQIEFETRKYAKKEESDAALPEKDFEYTAYFEFDEEINDPIVIFFNAKGICPQLKISQTSLDFKDCPMNSRRDILINIENKNEEISLDYCFEKIPHFFLKPEKGSFSPSQTSSFIVSFVPKTLGKYSETLNLYLMNKNYRIPFTLKGASSTISDKIVKNRGPEGLPLDFEYTKRFIEESTKFNKKRKGDRLIIGTQESKNVNVFAIKDEDKEENGDKFEELVAQQYNKNKYNQFLKATRLSRIERVKTANIRTKVMEMTERKKALGIIEQNDDEEKEGLPPQDYEFLFGMYTTGTEPEKLPIPMNKDILFVKKPIDKYEPVMEIQSQCFNPDPNQRIKKKFPSSPKSHAEIRDCNQELTGSMLQKIYAGPIEINFGNMYIKSTETKTFSVRNDLRNSILVRILIENEELKGSYSAAQVIPSSQTAGFEITLCSKQLQQFKSLVKYIINEKHVFEFKVVAQIEPVKLDINQKTLEFSFADDNLDMEKSQPIRIYNKGNSSGRFRWIMTEQKIFTIRPAEGEVPAKSSIDVMVTYKPTGNVVGSRHEEEKLRMKVEDGNEELIKCYGIVKEMKCVCKQDVLDLGQIPVCKKSDNNYLTLKNVYKNIAVFQISLDKLPPYVEITPFKDKILPDETKSLKVSFFCKEEIKIDSEITILFRGGKSLVIPFKVETILPKVTILEEELNFGEVTTLGVSSNLMMTLMNHSNIPATLILDLRDKDDGPKEYEGIECVDIEPKKDGLEDSSIMVSLNNSLSEGASEMLSDDEDKNNNEENSIESEDENEEKPSSRCYKILVKPKQPLYFNVRFSPKDVKIYQVELPLKLKGYGKLEGLAKNLICKGIKPKFLLQPQYIEFKKKIITTLDKCIPSVAEITISNPDKKGINWRIDTTKLDKTFSILPNEGFLEAGETHIIKASFNPLEIGEFSKTIPLFIENELTKPYLEINLKGHGANPRLLFDRREIILPIVPLNIVSRCVFRIINDGYENMALKASISKEFGPLNIEAEFFDGHTLGITKNKLSVEVRFTNKAPFSFTAKIEIIDDNGKSYFIPVSGTTDNSLFTNFPYFQRNAEKEYVFSEDENKPLTVSENIHDSLSNSIDNKSGRNLGSNNFFPGSKAASMTSLKSSMVALGYEPIPKNLLERSAEHIMRWMNHNALNAPIQSFPLDVINNNGIQIFELMTFLIGKSLNFKAKIDDNMKRGEKIQLLLKQYEELIKYLKENGGLLNTIRPYYLLSYTDYIFFLKIQPCDYVNPNSSKISENRFSYVSHDAWITLFYQIMKIFHLSRVSLKLVKSLPGIPAEKLLFPDYYLDGSNFLSTNEGILLRWLEINTELIYPKYYKRITNISQDLKSGLMYSACIQNYVGANSAKYLTNFKPSPTLDEELKINAEKILNALKEIWLQTHFTNKDLVISSPRENMLFIIHLLHTLPHYIPKAAPIVFSCVLGEEIIKNIELTNPTNKTISYWVKLEGSHDFSIEKENVKLEPGSAPLKFRVKFTSRVSALQTGRITFTNKKESNSQAAALVFDLQSQITQRKSLEEHHVQSKLYKMEEIRFQIKNIFVTSLSEYADFQISIIHEKMLPPPPVEDPKKSRKKPKKDEKKEVVAEDPTIIPAFFSMKEKVRVKRGDNTLIVIQFLPFVLDTHKCHVVFCDPNVGEFQHTIIGETLLPEPIKENIKPLFTVYVDTNHKFDIPLDFKNDFLKDARKFHEQRLSSSGRTKEKDAYFKLMQNYIHPENLNFEVELIPESPFVTGPKDITLFDPNKIGKKSSIAPLKANKKMSADEKESRLSDSSRVEIDENSLNTISLGLAFKSVLKDYNCLLILRNQNKSDVRVLRLMFTVHPKVIKAKLELKVPCGDEIKQEIPIVNNLERDCQIKVTLNAPPETLGQFFSGPRDFFVKKKSTNYYPITFRPPIICKSEARLTLFNSYTNDLMEFDLVGIGEEPLAKDHIILNCVARKPTTHIIEIPNPYKEKAINYKVETDLINPDGPPSFSVPPGKVFKYPLSVTPLLGGLYTGSITFYEEGEKNKYMWYTVLVNTDRPKSEKIIELNTCIRKAIAFNIEIVNPLREEVVYEAIIDGEYLIGPSTFQIPPKETYIYELLFIPFRVFKGKGSIAFIQEKLGEIWYEFNLCSEENPVIRSPTLRAELGKVEEWEVCLENPSNTECNVYAKISNPNNFDVIPENIIIPAYDSVNVKIRYTPSDLDVNETGEITLESDKIGKWQYLVYGIGLPPTKYEEKVVTGALNKDQSAMIHFKNPFKDVISCSIYMQYEDELSKDVLQLLLKKTKPNISGLSVLQIPFSFTPKEIMEYRATIIIHMNEKIEWKYPIKGITEAISQNISFNFKTKARIPIEKEIKINLQGLPKDFKAQKFSYELKNFPTEYEKLLRKCLQITEVKAILEFASDELIYKIRFTPMKSFKASCDIIIIKNLGGRWKYRINFEATEPECDDIINIYAPLNKTSSVSFKLVNRYKNSTPFNAYFTPESDPEFSIMPKNGDLDGLGKDGTNFVVSFSPVEYGKNKVAKLYIETEEILWSYIIKGSFPTYKPPTILQSKLENKLDVDVVEKLRHEEKKNFLAENMKKNRIQSAINYKEKQKLISKNSINNNNLTNIKK